MGRLILLAACLLIPASANAQYVEFEPTPVDIKQDAKVSDLEIRLAKLEKQDAKIVGLLETLTDKVAAIVPTPTPDKNVLPSIASKPAPKVIYSEPVVAKTVVRKTVSSSYSPRWHNNDGLSLRNHIIQEHGLDPNLSDAELYAAHDAWHDANGGAAPTSRVSRSRTVVRSFNSSCPNGVCPAQRGVSSGYGPLGIVRWR